MLEFNIFEILISTGGYDLILDLDPVYLNKK